MSYEFIKATPESQGVSSAVIEGVIEEFGKLDFMKGLIILRHGKMICDCFWSPFEKEVPQALWSLSKSFTSCAVGLAQQEGLLTIDTPLVDFFPEYRSCVADEKMFKVTLRDLLTMRSGHKQCAFAFARADSAGDWVRGFLSSPLEYEPGTRFVYNSLATYMLSAVIRRQSGLNVREYLMPRLFEPLSITPGPWDSCPAGTNYGGFGLHLTTMDIAKFAQLILQKGKWQGVRLLPEDYLEEAVKPHADNSMNEHPDWKCGYGFQFWRSRHGFRGDGACGQYALMLPEADMAIAINSSMSDMGRILDILWEKLLPVVKSVPLEENDSAQARLEKVCRNLRIFPAENSLQVRKNDCSFVFHPNAAGIEKGSLVFDGKMCTLTLKTPHGDEKIHAGFGHFQKSTIQIQDFRPHPVGACARWKDENTLEISVMHLDGTFRDTWEILFKENTAEFRWQTKCSLFRPLLGPLALKSFSQA